MKLSLYVALLWAVWHLPDHFAEGGWGVQALISAHRLRYRVHLAVLRPCVVCVVHNVTAFSVLSTSYCSAEGRNRRVGTRYCDVRRQGVS
jgi:hypothetical protein